MLTLYSAPRTIDMRFVDASRCYDSCECAFFEHHAPPMFTRPPAFFPAASRFFALARSSCPSLAQRAAVCALQRHAPRATHRARACEATSQRGRNMPAGCPAIPCPATAAPRRPPCSAASLPLLSRDSAAIPPRNDVTDRSATFCHVSAAFLPRFRPGVGSPTPRPSQRPLPFCRDSTPVRRASAACLPFVTSSRASTGVLPVFCRCSAAVRPLHFSHFSLARFFLVCAREKRGTAATPPGL